MKKILLATRPITPPWDEASKNFAYFLAKSIDNPDIEMHLLTPRQKVEDLPSNVVQEPIYSQTDFSRAGYPFSQKMLLMKHLFANSRDYDIIHYLFTPTTLNSAIIQFGNRLQGNAFKTIQTIATLREDLHGPESWKKLFFADKLVVYSDYSKVRLEAAGFTNVERIYPGIDLDLYFPQPKDSDTIKHFDITQDDFVVSYFGEYARLGATDMLVDMLVKYINTDENKTMKFIFACRVKNDADQKKKDEVVARLTQAGIIDRVRFSDTFKDMPKLYNLTDVVLFPVGNMRGKFDIPLVIIEGYACGKPVIVSDLPIFTEFSSPDISVTVPKRDGDALWSAIEDLRNNEAKKKALSINARAFVEQHFDLRNTAREYEKLYRSF